MVWYSKFWHFREIQGTGSAKKGVNYDNEELLSIREVRAEPYTINNDRL